ncbi:unnamed protein product [Chironomus riparius]|uniref:Glutaredoxin-2, mitochondrial n=1 Tax=Chironomus riparius TaxID=315576 RepID=A0A9N9RKA3_9DIPT|nr:unnamed protein product [Chironomus riparius]
MGASSTKSRDPEIENFVQETIEKNRVVIFSKTFCPYCTMAKNQFEMLNAEYKAIEIENRQDCDQIQDVLGDMTGARSVPRVFVNGNFIGGGTDVKKLYQSGQLAKMLNQS